MQTRSTTPRQRTSGLRSVRSPRPLHALVALLLAAAVALAGCTGADEAGGTTSDSDSGDKAAAQSEQGAGDARDSGGKGRQATAPPKLSAAHIIRTASLTVQVKDVPKALAEARTAVENAGGVVGQETTDRDSKGRERSRVVLRVPTDRYEEVLDDLEGSGKLIDRTAKAEDVTDQVVDVESRIKTQRASVIRIRELMDQATQLSDVVTLEGELSTRQADLESLLAQQASLKDRTSLATITLSLSETPVKAAEDEDPGLADALAGGWNAFIETFRWIAMALAAVLPFLVGAALLLLLWTRVLRPRLPRRPATAGAGTATAGMSLPVARPAPGEDGKED
ncbi:DUF4349 domain-containing protein [Streptomyces sp. NBC_00286]|uniref:DUF4349 domain-containing protein n=1 Tax=Streptomyces sp. NBC_00286 TaxID=2975701 RepID=UPI002E2B68F6|nr:DUF4349 domain-containing protein [Streptomyces sp. NBC_00286]